MENQSPNQLNTTPFPGAEEKQYEVSPEIKAAYGWAPGFMQTGAEHMRRMYGGAKHGAGEGADKTTSLMANKLRQTYGSDRLTDATDAEIVDAYRQFKFPEVQGTDSRQALLSDLLPGYVEPSPTLASGLAEMGSTMVNDVLGAPILAATSIAGIPMAMQKVRQAESRVKQLRAAGHDETSQTYQEAVAEYHKNLDALHGQTQIAPMGGAMLGATIAGMLTGGTAKGISTGAATGARALASRLPAVTHKVAGTIINRGLEPAVRVGTEFAVWEGAKYGLLGQFDKVPAKAWEGAQSGAVMGPAFGLIGGAFSKAGQRVRRAWGDLHPNAATTALKDGGATIIQQIARDTKGAIDDFRIDFDQELRPQVEAITARLFGPEIGPSTAAKEFVDDLTQHFAEYRLNNPQFKPGWKEAPGGGPAAEAPASSGQPLKVDANTPDEQLNKVFVGPDGAQVNVRQVKSLRFLINRYNLLDEGTDPSLKEAMWREILRRNFGKAPEEKVAKPPSWRRPPVDPTAGPAPTAEPPKGELPPGWGTNPADSFFNPDTPVERVGEDVASAWKAHPRWDPRTDGELYPERAETLREALSTLARKLLERAREDVGFTPAVPRPHPGWGELTTVAGESARQDLEQAAALLNEYHGPGTAEVVYPTAQSASLRINKDFEAWNAGGRVGEYMPHYMDTRDYTPMTQEEALFTMKRALRMLGFPDEPTAVADAGGRIYMTNVDEYAQHLLDAAAESGPAVSPQLAQKFRNAWVQAQDEIAARLENESRDFGTMVSAYDEGLGPVKPGMLPAGLLHSRQRQWEFENPWDWGRPRPPKPAVIAADAPVNRVIEAIGEPVVAKNGTVIPGVRIFAGKNLAVKVSSDGEAVTIGKFNTYIADNQLRDILIHADREGAAIDRIINVTGANKKAIEKLAKIGFREIGTREGATVFRRLPAQAGTVTMQDAVNIAPNNPVVQERIVGKTLEDARLAAGNVEVGKPAIQAPAEPATLSPDNPSPVKPEMETPSIIPHAAGPELAPPPQTPPSPPARNLGRNQIAFVLHTRPGAKKSDIIKEFGEKAKRLNFMLRKDGPLWIVTFDNKKVGHHGQGWMELEEMGVPETLLHKSGFWDPNTKKYIEQDVYYETNPYLSAPAAPSVPQNLDAAIAKVMEEASKMETGPVLDAASFAEAEQYVNPLVEAIAAAWEGAKASNSLAKLISNHDYKNKIQIASVVYDVFNVPRPPKLSAIVEAINPSKK